MMWYWGTGVHGWAWGLGIFTSLIFWGLIIWAVVALVGELGPPAAGPDRPRPEYGGKAARGRVPGHTGPGAQGRTGPGAQGRTGPGAQGRTGPGAQGRTGPGARGATTIRRRSSRAGTPRVRSTRKSTGSAWRSCALSATLPAPAAPDEPERRTRLTPDGPRRPTTRASG